MPRKRSLETELRHAKRGIREEHDAYQRAYLLSQALKVELSERKRIGSMIANICFNLANRTDDMYIKRTMDECRIAWDGIPNGGQVT